MNKTVFNVQKVKDLIHESGMRKAFIAKSLGITTETLRQRVGGKSDFSMSEMSALANLLQVQPAVFFTEAFDKSANVVIK